MNAKKYIFVMLSVIVVLLLPLTVYAEGIIQFDGDDDNDVPETTTSVVTTTQTTTAHTTTTTTETTTTQPSTTTSGRTTTARNDVVTTSKSFTLAMVPALEMQEEEETTEVSTTEPELSENENSHYWEIYGFDIALNEVYLTCRYCGAMTSVRFTGVAGTEPGEEGTVSYACDVNQDGIINGRDLVYLTTGFRHWLDDGEKQDKQFFYVYMTILFVVLGTVLCIAVRRRR